MSFIVIFCSKGDTLGVSYFEPMRFGYQASTQIKYFSSIFYVFSIEVYVITDLYHTTICTYKANRSFEV
jgi:hypothetical protein